MADSASDYQVGRGRPPLHTRFRKGQSGNRGGRSTKSLPGRCAERDGLRDDRRTAPHDHQARGDRHAKIFITDQGAQFTSAAFTDKLYAAGVRISMDGRGRWLDNVFVERLWRSLKYEEVHLKAYA